MLYMIYVTVQTTIGIYQITGAQFCLNSISIKYLLHTKCKNSGLIHNTFTPNGKCEKKCFNFHLYKNGNCIKRTT